MSRTFALILFSMLTGIFNLFGQSEKNNQLNLRPRLQILSVQPYQFDSNSEYFSYSNLPGLEINSSIGLHHVFKGIISEFFLGHTYTNISQHMTFSNPVDLSIANRYKQSFNSWHSGLGIGYHFQTSSIGIELIGGFKYVGLYTKWILSEPKTGTFTSEVSTGANFHDSKTVAYDYEITYFGNNFFSPYANLNIVFPAKKGNLTVGLFGQLQNIPFTSRVFISSNTSSAFADTNYKGASFGLQVSYDFFLKRSGSN